MVLPQKRKANKTFKQKITSGICTTAIVIAGAGLATVAVSNAASAQDVPDAVQEQMDMAGGVADALVAMIGAFTTAAISPIGISAAVKCFRHIVLANV